MPTYQQLTALLCAMHYAQHGGLRTGCPIGVKAMRHYGVNACTVLAALNLGLLRQIRNKKRNNNWLRMYYVTPLGKQALAFLPKALGAQALANVPPRAVG